MILLSGKTIEEFVLQTPIKVDKQEEENTMKQLLQDDFIDDPSLEPNYDNCPIVLPFSKWFSLSNYIYVWIFCM